MVKVLFVCMGNICRSPTAEGVFRQKVIDAGLADHILIDSAGTHAYHVGEPPDNRAQKAARSRGFDLSAQRARKVDPTDMVEFDYVIAMDRANLKELESMCPAGYEGRISLFLDFGEQTEHAEVPDPYYGGANGFEKVLDMVEDAAAGLLEQIRRSH